MIRIKNARLVRENVSAHLHKLWGEGREFVDDDWVEKKVDEYKKAWGPLEEKILRGMMDILSLSFRQNIIDVYIAPWFRAFSDPLVIGVKFEPDRFVDILTHELLHRLLSDNTAIPSEFQILSEWEKLFGSGHSKRMLVHIPVHAVHKAIYLEVLQATERLERDVEVFKKIGAKDYVDAWEYVETHGYQKITEELKGSYESLSSN